MYVLDASWSLWSLVSAPMKDDDLMTSVDEATN